MKKTLKQILFFGTEDFSARFLTALLDEGYDIRAVITKPDSPRGRGHTMTSPLVKRIAIERGIDVWQPEKLKDLTDQIRALGDVAGVLVSYGKIVPASIIELFSPGIINVHPSLLPKYRGPSPIEAAIVNRDELTGVSIMKLEAAMDAGPVYSQVVSAISAGATKQSQYELLGELGIKELLTTLSAILDGSLVPNAQDESQATYCQLLTKEAGIIDPTLLTALQAEAMVRAYQGFPKTRLRYRDHTIIITKAHVSDTEKTPLDVRCLDGQYLIIDQLVAPSGKTMDAESFLRGYAA